MRLFSANFTEFSLGSRWRAGLLLTLVGLAGLVTSVVAIKVATVKKLAESTEVSRVQRALALDPNNPRLHSRLSLLYCYSSEQLNLTEAVAHGRRATELNPHDFACWWDLASACESIDDDACAEQAFRQVLTLNPMKPRLWWAVGSHFLRTDHPEAALPYFKHLLELDLGYARSVFRVCLRAWGDPKVILQNVLSGAKDSRLELAFADFLSANGDFEGANQAWEQIVSSHSPFPYSAVAPYLERLLNQGYYQDAWGVWQELKKMRVLTKPADIDGDNLVFNGGFEQLPLEAGFDWRSRSAPYVSLDFADRSAYQGDRCLRIDFTVSQNDEYEPASQILPAVANQAYLLTANVRSKDITSDSGPRLRVIDPACPSCLNASTGPTVGTTPWHAVTLEFSAGAQTQAFRLSVWRPRGRTFPNGITGSFWLDSVSIRALVPAGKDAEFRGTR